MDAERAYSLLSIKSINDDDRILEGIASTPEVDRAGDIVEPGGATFRLPLPLLWQHDKAQPIGDVIDARVTDDGIMIRARVARVLEPGRLRDRLDEAWHTLKAGLVRGLSVGFVPLASAPIKSAGRVVGQRITRWSWLELSAVTIPANQTASITAIKAADTPASGRAVALDLGPASRATTTTRRGANPMTFKEQIAAFEATRAAKAARQTELITAANDKGETLDEASAQEFDGLASEIKGIDEHLVRMRATEAANAAAAKAVVASTPESASASRVPATASPVVRVTDNLDPGIEFARLFICRTLAFMDRNATALDYAKARYPDHARLHLALKVAAPVGGGTTTDANFAAQLAYPQDIASAFVEFLRPQTIIGRVPGLYNVPFNIRVGTQTTGGTASWVGQGKGKPLTGFQFGQITLGITKLAAISVLSDELVRVSSPRAEQVVRDTLAACVQQQMDKDFIDPDNAGVANVKPASITNGVAALTSAGNTADKIVNDIIALVAPIAAAGLDPTRIVFVMPATRALALGLVVNALGQREFPNVDARGGTVAGYNVVTTQLASNIGTYGDVVIAVHAPSVYVADEGGVTVDASREASLEMVDAPTQDAGAAPVAASLVSMWQTNMLALRAERVINWKKVRPAAVAWMSHVAWGQ